MRLTASRIEWLRDDAAAVLRNARRNLARAREEVDVAQSQWAKAKSLRVGDEE